MLPLPTAYSAEPAEEFLKKLRERGYFDMAEAYLERIQDSPQSPPDFQERLPYERALCAMQVALRDDDPDQKAAGMARARGLFTAYLAQSPNSPPSTAARTWISRILLEQARVAASKAEAAAGSNEKQPLRAKSAKLYQEAEKSFRDQVAELRKRLLELRKSKNVDTDERDRLQNEYLQARFAVAEILYATAAPKKSDPKAYKKQLEKAAAEFGDLGDKYSNKMIGLQSIVLQGKCCQDLGQYKKAMTFYEEFLNPELARGPTQRIAAQAVKYTLQCLGNEGLKQWEQAITTGESWLNNIRTAGATAPSVQDVQLEIARIQIAWSEQPDTSDPKRLINSARKHVLSIARRPGPKRREAREILAGLGGKKSNPVGEQVRSFADAKMAGDDAFESVRTLDVAVRLLRRQLKTTQEPKARESVREELKKLTGDVDRTRRKSVDYYRQSLRMAARNLPAEELNGLRFRQAYLLFGLEEYLEAAAIGEFVATKFPEFAFAKQSANIAMASYLRMYGDGTDAATVDFARPRAVGIADFLARTWPNQKEAQDALVTLVSFMVTTGDIESAQAYLQKIPPDSPRRAEAELRTGQALWAKYVAQAKKEGPRDESLRKQAEETLRRGLDAMRKSGKSQALVQAALSLAQIYVATEQPDKALKLLKDDEIGPVTLVEKGDSIAKQPGFGSAAYKTQLRAYLGKSVDPANTDEAMAGAKEAMERLRAVVGDSEQGRKRLIATYVGLAKDLQDQMAIMSTASKQSLAKGFELFLTQVSADSKEFSVLNWVAETFFRLGKTLETDSGEMTPAARQYFARAGDAYESILNRASGGEFEIEDAYKLQIRMRRASTMRRLGEYGKALDEFEQVLRKRNNMINVQIEAAHALQAGGQAGQPDLFSEAVNGGRRNANTGKNTIWGWSLIGRKAQAQMRKSDELRQKFEPLFFLSQFQAANCRYQQALAANGDKRKKYLNSSQRMIGFLSGSYPEMGGEDQRTEFDELLKLVQQALGVPVSGLAEPSRTSAG